MHELGQTFRKAEARQRRQAKENIIQKGSNRITSPFTECDHNHSTCGVPSTAGACRAPPSSSGVHQTLYCLKSTLVHCVLEMGEAFIPSSYPPVFRFCQCRCNFKAKVSWGVDGPPTLHKVRQKHAKRLDRSSLDTLTAELIWSFRTRDGRHHLE